MAKENFQMEKDHEEEKMCIFNISNNKNKIKHYYCISEVQKRRIILKTKEDGIYKVWVISQAHLWQIKILNSDSMIAILLMRHPISHLYYQASLNKILDILHI